VEELTIALTEDPEVLVVVVVEDLLQMEESEVEWGAEEAKTEVVEEEDGETFSSFISYLNINYFSHFCNDNERFSCSKIL